MQIRVLKILEIDLPSTSSVKRKLTLDRTSIHTSDRNYITKTKVEEILLKDENSLIVPDTKTKHERS